MRLGILGTADIAYRRFLPALQMCPEITYAGVASRQLEKTERFVEAYGGQGYPSYEALLADQKIDAVYVPLPPALHYEWGEKVLGSGKHLLMEKPFTICQRDTETLLALAEKKNLAVHENYMFLYHSQLQTIRELIANRELGELRLLRMSFGFPKRGEDDFRYQKELGGGALLDCGGYPVRLALELLGNTVQVVQAKLSQPVGYEVDLYGSAVLENDKGACAQIAFGMDNSYKCELEIWGSAGSCQADRIFTAPPDHPVELKLKIHGGEQTIAVGTDNAFLKSIRTFYRMCAQKALREKNVAEIRKQSCLTDTLYTKGTLL